MLVLLIVGANQRIPSEANEFARELLKLNGHTKI